MPTGWKIIHEIPSVSRKQLVFSTINSWNIMNYFNYSPVHSHGDGKLVNPCKSTICRYFSFSFPQFSLSPHYISMYMLPPQYTCWRLGDVPIAMVKLNQPQDIFGEIQPIFPQFVFSKIYVYIYMYIYIYIYRHYLCTKWACLKSGYTPKIAIQ